MIRIEKRKGWNDIKHRKARYILNDETDAVIVWELICEKEDRWEFTMEQVLDINHSLEAYEGTVEQYFEEAYS